MKHRCPVCNKTLEIPVEEPSGHAGFLPFCSERCKLVDLGAWLDADYKIVTASNSQEPAEPAD